MTTKRQTTADRKRDARTASEAAAWATYKSIPQKHWIAMSGRAAKVLREQAVRYGLPFGGATISLPDLAKSLHDFLARNAAKIARDTDPMLAGPESPALERYREDRALLARLDRKEREQSLIPRDQARIALGRIASIIRNCGETLQRQFGPAALEILNEAIDDAQQETDRAFGEIANEKPAP